MSSKSENDKRCSCSSIRRPDRFVGPGDFFDLSGENILKDMAADIGQSEAVVFEMVIDSRRHNENGG